MSNIPTKRRNPFARTINNETPTIETEPKIEVEKEETPILEQEDEEIEVKKVPQKTKKIVVQEDDENREKYTATMETALRRKIKIFCATNGIMFSEFIEIACKEKLRREGIK